MSVRFWAPLVAATCTAVNVVLYVEDPTRWWNLLSGLICGMLFMMTLVQSR